MEEFLIIYQIKFGEGIKTSSLYVTKRHNRICLLLLFGLYSMEATFLHF
jgi:hypothetical protein